MDEEAARGFIYGIANDLFYYLKSWVWFFINQIVAVDKSEAQLSVDLFNYINQHYPKFEWGDLTHFVRKDNSKKIKEFLMRMPKDNAIFWVDGWPVLATSQKGDFDCSEMPRTFFYLRWGIDWSKLMYKALAYKNTRNSRQSRFRVLAYTGKKSNSTKRAEMQKEIPMLGGAAGMQNIESTPVGFSEVQLEETDRMVLDRLEMTDEMIDINNEISFMFKEKDWFRERGLPWKLGYLFYGPPGTGKSSFARGLAERQQVPIVLIDLAEMDNDELRNCWMQIQGFAPAIVLIEDIDAVFKGRENVSAEGELTFDCLLNVLDGAQKAEGMVVIITTNHPEVLDAALWKFEEKSQTAAESLEEIGTRPGRIDRALELKLLPDANKLSIAKRIAGADKAVALVQAGKNDSAAQFQERCRREAVREKMKQRLVK